MTDAKKHLPVYSPTQIELWQGRCLRKAAFRFIDRVKLPPKPWLDRGNLTHELLQTAKQTDTLPPQQSPEARMASAFMGYWPQRRDWEQEIEVEVDRGTHIFRGKADMHGKAWGFVGDYKTTGHISKLPWDTREWWIKDLVPIKPPKSQDEIVRLITAYLRKHPQPNIYGGATEGDLVRARWLYGIKAPKANGEPKIIPVDFSLTRAEVEANLQRFDRVVDLAEFIKANYQSANDVPHNADEACGGVRMRCDYAEHCNVFESRKDDPNMPTIAELMSKAGLKLPNQDDPTPKVNPPDAVVPGPAVAEPTPAIVDAVVVNETPAQAAPAPEAPKTRKPRTPRAETGSAAPSAAEAGEEVEATVISAGTYQDEGPLETRASFMLPLGVRLPIGGKVKVIL